MQNTVIWECYDYLQESDHKPQSILMFIFLLQSSFWETYSWNKDVFFQRQLSLCFLFLKSLLKPKSLSVVGWQKQATWILSKTILSLWMKIKTPLVCFVWCFRPSKKESQESSGMIPAIFKKKNWIWFLHDLLNALVIFTDCLKVRHLLKSHSVQLNGAETRSHCCWLLIWI